MALKLLHSGSSEAKDGERFIREAQILSELRHPHIVSHIAHGQTYEGQRYIAMEWLEGQDLGHRLSRGPLPLPACLALLRPAAEALSLAHGRGIIHRDRTHKDKIWLRIGDSAIEGTRTAPTRLRIAPAEVWPHAVVT